MEFSKFKGTFPEFFDSVRYFSKLTGSQEPVEPTITESLIHFQLPWIAEFIMESGWAQEILSDLSKVHRGGLEIGVKAAFDDLLSSLVASGGQDVIDEFQKNGAIQVCQTHTLKELARAVANEAVKNNRNK